MVTKQPMCHICGSEGEPLLPWASGGGEMRHCSTCDFVFAWPVEEIDPVEVYTQAYEGHETRTQMDDYARRISRRDVVAEHESLGLWSPAHHDTLAWIEANVPKGATVMEVGCGLGAFLRALRDRGYNAVGIDVAKPVVEAAQREGFQAWCGTIDTVPEGWAQPAVIVSFFVIHHIQDPVAFLSTIRTRWGVPLIIAYNRAPTKETFDTNNFPPRCWGWWSEKALGRALARAGFARVEISTQAKGLPQIFLPPKLHDFVSSVLWRWPKLRVMVQPFVEKLLSAGFKLLRPIPRLRRSFEGGLLIIATPAETNGRVPALEEVKEVRA